MVTLLPVTKPCAVAVVTVAVAEGLVRAILEIVDAVVVVATKNQRVPS
jgi:hypothetical protein